MEDAGTQVKMVVKQIGMKPITTWWTIEEYEVIEAKAKDVNTKITPFAKELIKKAVFPEGV